MILAGCRLLPLRPVSGYWYRAVPPQYWQSALATGHTVSSEGRFNSGKPDRPGFEVMYLASDHSVALFEVGALLGSPYPGRVYVPNPLAARSIINVEVSLSRVADLTHSYNLRLLQTTVQELTGDWEGYPLRPNPDPVRPPYYTNVPTQRLGHALVRRRGLEGFLSYSARNPVKTNLIVFPQKLRPGSFVRFTDPLTGDTVTIP